MIASLYAALLAIFYLALSINVISSRRAHKISLGDGGIDRMQKRVRAHANFSEYTPLFLILLGLAEYQGLPSYAVHLFGVAFLIGRVFHAYSILFTKPSLKLFQPRPIGMILTLISIGSLALILLTRYL